jgi:hypothetical protein
MGKTSSLGEHGATVARLNPVDRRLWLPESVNASLKAVQIVVYTKAEVLTAVTMFGEFEAL